MIDVDNENTTAFESSIAELARRCNVARIPCEDVTIGPAEVRVIKINLSAGRDSRQLVISSDERAQQLLGVPFENVVYLGDYRAICCYDDGYIEASVDWLSQTILPPQYVWRSLLGRRDSADDEEAARSVLTVSRRLPVGEVSLELSTVSELYLATSQFGWRGRNRLSLKIRGFPISTHDEALSVLERVGIAFLFQIDLERDVPLGLTRERPLVRHRGPSLRAAEEGSLEFPRQEFDAAPIALYWYARSARGMPLLQFLAFYQCIEFYFPTYFQAEARRRVRNVFKDPTFRVDRDADIARVLAAGHGGAQGAADERSMLTATIHECVAPADLRAFFEEDELRTSFFSAKTKGLTDVRIPIAGRENDLRNDVAHRIYDIRCKIVHTKASGRGEDIELLLPYSKEEKLLYHDIDLAQFVARNVLVAASSPLRV